MLLRQSMVYGLGNAIQAALAIVLISIYTRLLSVDEFGIYALVLTNVQFGYQTLMNWVCVSFVRLYHRISDKRMLLGAYLGVFAFVTIGGLLITLGMLPFLDNREQARLALLGYSLFVAMSWMELNMRLFQARLEAARQARARIVRSVVTAILGGGLTWYGWGPSGALVGAIIGMAVVGLPQSMREWGQLPFGGDESSRREVWRFGAPLALTFAVGAAGAFAGRYLIVVLEGAALLGVFVICTEIATRITTFLLTPIGAASSSITFFELKEKGRGAVRERLRHACLLMLGLVIPGAVGLAIVSPDIAATLVGEEFRENTALILPIVGLAVFAQRFRGEYLDQALHLGLRSDRLLWASVATLVVSLAINYVLIYQLGLLGAAYASLLVSFVGIVLVTAVGRTSFPLPFPLLDVVKVSAASLVMFAGLLAIPLEPGIPGLLLRMVAGASIYLIAITILDVGQLRSFISGHVRAFIGETRGGSG